MLCATNRVPACRGGHRHGVQEEAYVVVSGSGRAKLDDDVVELSAWDVLRFIRFAQEALPSSETASAKAETAAPV